MTFPSVGLPPYPRNPSLILRTAPCPYGAKLWRVGSLVVRERSNRAGSSSFSEILQPAVCGDEGLRVVESGHRPLATGSEGSENFCQNEDSLVCSSLGAERGLDGCL